MSLMNTLGLGVLLGGSLGVTLGTLVYWVNTVK